MIEEVNDVLTFGQLNGIFKPNNGALLVDRNHNVIPRDKIFANVPKYGDTEVKFIEVYTNGEVVITLDIEEEK